MMNTYSLLTIITFILVLVLFQKMNTIQSELMSMRYTRGNKHSAKASSVTVSEREASIGSAGTHILTVDVNGNIHLLPISNIEMQIGEGRRKAEEYTDNLLRSYATQSSML